MAKSPYAKKYAQADRLRKKATEAQLRLARRIEREADKAADAVRAKYAADEQAVRDRIQAASDAARIALELEVQRIQPMHALTLTHVNEPDWEYERRRRRLLAKQGVPGGILVTEPERRKRWLPFCSCMKATTVRSDPNDGRSPKVPDAAVQHRSTTSVLNCVDAHAGHVRSIARANLSHGPNLELY